MVIARQSTIFLYMAIATALSACGGSGDPVASSAANAILMETELTQTGGSLVDVTGKWVSNCRGPGDGLSVDFKEVHKFENGQLSVGKELFTTTNGTCATGNNIISYGFANMPVTVMGKKVVIGWLNGMGSPASAPMREDGTGALTANPNVTTMKIDASAYSMGTLGDIYYVDDTGSTRMVLYRSKEISSSDGYPDHIGTADPLFRVK